MAFQAGHFPLQLVRTLDARLRTQCCRWNGCLCIPGDALLQPRERVVLLAVETLRAASGFVQVSVLLLPVIVSPVQGIRPVFHLRWGGVAGERTVCGRCSVHRCTSSIRRCRLALRWCEVIRKVWTFRRPTLLVVHPLLPLIGLLFDAHRIVVAAPKIAVAAPRCAGAAHRSAGTAHRSAGTALRSAGTALRTFPSS